MKTKVFFAVLPLLLAYPWQWLSSHAARVSPYLEAVVMRGLGLTLAAGCFAVAVVPSGALPVITKIKAWAGRRFFWIGSIFLLVVFAALIAVNRGILHSFLSSGDEHSCYFLAECLRRGKLFVSPHPLSEFFNVVHVGNRDGKWFSVYPLGWPLIWALGLQWRIVDLLNPFMTSLSLVFFYQAGQKLFGRLAAALGVFLMAISPFFMFTSASYFSHGTCLLAVGVFIFSFLKWTETESSRGKIAWAILCGLACGYGLLTRYLTMAAIAAPFCLYHYIPLFLRRRKWHASDLWFIGVVSVFIAITLWHNWRVTGKATKAPNKYDKRWERLGFQGDYTPLDAARYVIARFFYLMPWFPAALIAGYLLSLGWPRAEAGGKRNLFRWGFFYPVFGYFFYYSWGGNQWGPRYYYEGLPFLAITVAEFLVYLYKVRGPMVRKFILGVAIACLPAVGMLWIKQAAFYRQAQAERKALYVLAETTIRTPAIVFIRGHLGGLLPLLNEDTVRNSPFLDTRILYAHDLGEKNNSLMAYFPDRDYYLGYVDRPSGKNILEKIER